MSLDLIRAVAQTELDDNLHMARLMFLLASRSGKSRRSIEGLTKLAKLDFLLRYPNCLIRALAAIGDERDKNLVEDFERTTLESKMIRFKYGPWDHRYRRWVALLVAKGLAEVAVSGRTVHVRPTELGLLVVGGLSEHESLNALAIRASLVGRKFGSRSGSDLKAFIYETFPELTSMKWGEEISI